MLLDYEVVVRNRFVKVKEMAGKAIKDFFTDEQGDTNMISIILVLVIVIALAALIRENISSMVTAMWESISDKFNAASGTDADINTGF